MTFESYDLLETNRMAHDLVDLGYHLVPCELGGKTPLIPWKHSASSHDLVDRWFDAFRHVNIAIHAGKSGVLALDADTDRAADWIRRNCPATPMTASTPRGGHHAYFRAPAAPPAPAQDLFGLGLDLRSGGSLLLASPSWSAEHRRRWRWDDAVLPPAQLPEIDPRLISREPSPAPKTRDHPDVGTAAGPIRDVTRWIMEVESVEGQGGSNRCFKVACRLVDAGLSWEEAWTWLCRWNESGRAIPPWSEAELRHKLRDAFARPRGPQEDR